VFCSLEMFCGRGIVDAEYVGTIDIGGFAGDV
jgi:hypothetical protein